MRKITLCAFFMLLFTVARAVTVPTIINNSGTTSFRSGDLLDLEVQDDGDTYTWDYPPAATESGLYLGIIVTSANSGVYTVTADDGGTTATATITITVIPSPTFIGKVLLGACLPSGSLMHDSLRNYGLIPSGSPYSSGYTIDPGVLTTSGSDAIVDWVLIELRSKTNNTNILYSYSLLLQRDGDMVTTDGAGNLLMRDPLIDSYYVAVKHRNHLGVMTATPVPLTEAGNLVDFTNVSTSLYSRASPYHNPSPLSGPTLIRGGKRALYYGNSSYTETPQRVSYSGVGDRIKVLNVAGMTGNIFGYNNADITMNGYTNFNYPNNSKSDRYSLLDICQGSTSLIIWEQLP